MATQIISPRKRRKPVRPLVLLRPVPGRSPVHELWAGTKLVTVAVFAALLAFVPGWAPLTAVGVFVLVTGWLAKVPWSALPSLPRWLWVVMWGGAILCLTAGGSPYLTLGPLQIGLSALLSYLQVTMLIVVMMGVCALVSWTTNLSEIAPAVLKLGRPLRALRFPIDDWAVTLALTLRAFPMLMHEFRVLFAARKLRPRAAAESWRERRRRLATEVIDLMSASMTVSLRRADEMGDAITARGGSGQISTLPSRPETRDALALALVLAVCVLSVVIHISVFA